jgi:hypothetical protein
MRSGSHQRVTTHADGRRDGAAVDRVVVAADAGLAIEAAGVKHPVARPV